MQHKEIIERASLFVRGVGIEMEEGKVGEDCFVPGIEIRGGKIVFDRNEIRFPGDLFHEAGHIAVCEPAARNSLSGSMIANGEQKEGEEIAAILWSYFAAKQAGVPLSQVFHDGGYKGESTWLEENFAVGRMIGLPLLEWMGIAAKDPTGVPVIINWLRK
jgi:hypothetical protein